MVYSAYISIIICSFSLCIGFPFKLPHHIQPSHPKHGCDICADIVFLFDDSSSIPVADPHGFHKMKDFMVAVVQSFSNFGPPNGVQVSVVLVAHTVRNYFYLNNFTHEADIVHNMKIFPEIKGSATAIGEGLKFVREKSFLPKFGGERLCADKFLILLTDGKHNLGALPKPQAEALKDEGVTIFVIGVGPKVLMSELLAIASKPEYVFNVTDFNQLAAINDRIVDDACKVAKDSKLTPQPCSLEQISKTLIPYGYALVPVFYPLTKKKMSWPPAFQGLDQLDNEHHLPWLTHNEHSHKHGGRWDK
ncbi:collagen alpha-1(XII) chain-like [Mytilus californianus]|uniref:collagen alpha-1(XII) chain-like n=1 Tax=Mytilus californianus TaxID=6549 RepID=UPI002247E4A1|nr:collagen alpha-1(XII) chain-like [Mytilus californianus]